MIMKRTEIDFPDCWEELTPPEWLYLLRLCARAAAIEGTTAHDIRLCWCRYVLKRRMNLRMSVSSRMRSLVQQERRRDYLLLLGELADTLGWMWQRDDAAGTEWLYFHTTTNLLPSFKGLVGPQSHAGSLTFGEFRHALMWLKRYDDTHNPTELAALCGTLYRPADEPFFAARTGTYIDRAAVLPRYVQGGIRLWFSYLCSYLTTGVFIVDDTEVCFAPLFDRPRLPEAQGDEEPVDADTDPADGQPRGGGFTEVLLTMAESGVFGTAREVDEAPLLHVLMKMLMDYRKLEELKKK
jgi:hypothetical protein